jgi:hypothetical protein
MSTFEEILREKAKEIPQSKYMKLEEIPNKIKLKMLKKEEKLDANKNSCFYVTYQSEDEKLLTQKYTATMFTTLADRVHNREKELETSFALYEKIDTKTFRGRTGFPRLYPVLVSQESRSKNK